MTGAPRAWPSLEWHYSDVTNSAMASQLFAEPFVQTPTKGNIKVGASQISTILLNWQLIQLYACIAHNM